MKAQAASGWGMALLIQLMKATGPGIIKLIVVPVTLYYFLVSPTKRSYSAQYIKRLKVYSGASFCPLWFAVFKHFLSFSWSMVDRIHTWDAGSSGIEYHFNDQPLLDRVFNSETGAIIITSHLGNFDLAIARANENPNKALNVVMDTSQTKAYNQFRGKIFNSGQIRFLEPSAITPIGTVDLVNRVNNGEIIIIAADRVNAATDKNSVQVSFLGELACFPIGCYVLGHILQVPMYNLFVTKYKKACSIDFGLFEKQPRLPRATRQQQLSEYAQRFSSRLEKACLETPLQWYNFYDFWAKPTLNNTK